MLHNEKYQEFVIEVNPKKLFKRCKANKVPFHQWYQWIEREILVIAKEQRPDLYALSDLGVSEEHKKGGFMSRIRRMFKGSNANTSSVTQSMFEGERR